MQNLLKQALQYGDTTAIERHIEKYLPKDQNNLKRIYKQLQAYDPNNKERQQQKQIERAFNNSIFLSIIQNRIKNQQKRSKSKETYDRNKKSLSNNITRSKSMMRVLKTKGVNPKFAKFNHSKKGILQQGLQIFNKECSKLILPMHPNIQSRYLHQIKINQSKLKSMFEKFQINRALYEPNKDQNQQEFKGFNSQMSDFLETRKRLLTQLNNNKEYQKLREPQIKKFKAIKSRVFSAQNYRNFSRKSLPQFNQMVRTTKPSTSQSTFRSSHKKQAIKQIEPQNFENYSSKINYLIEQTFIKNQNRLSSLSISKSSINKLMKKVPKNMFDQLSQKIQEIKDQNRDINQKTKKIAHNQFITEYYNRFTRDYINMLKLKDDKSLVNHYKRDLLLDAKKN